MTLTVTPETDPIVAGRSALLAQLAPDDARRPLLDAMLVENERLLRPLLALLTPADHGAYLELLDEIWSALRAVGTTTGPARVAEVIRGLQFHSVEFLRRQANFCRSGAYLAESAEAVRESVYEQEPVMQEYLDGLLLTYAAWPNHYRLQQFYRASYLARGPAGRCLEVGPGHGWLALQQLRADASNTLCGLDISPSSVRYTEAMLRAGGIDSSRFEIRRHDATTGFDVSGTTFDRIVMAEVLEHVECPDVLLREAVAHAHGETAIFLSTVVNIEAVDHLYLYRTLDDVRTMVRDCGLEIEDECALPLEFAVDAEPSWEVALICRRAEAP